MVDIDVMKECRLPISENLKQSRIMRCPLDCGDRFMVNDQLESNGCIKIFEHLGGTVYISNDGMNYSQNNVVPVAGISVSIRDKETVQIDKIFCEFGYMDFISKLMQQIMNFADFYGLRVSIVDIRKGDSIRDIRKCRFVDMKFW